MRLLLAFVLAAMWFQVNAALIPEKDREELIVLVLKNFWGRAKLSNGQYAQPSSEAERNSVPVSKAIAYRAMDAGEFSGLGEWCKLDWQSHYFALTKAARAKGLTDKQVAFVSFLHGAAQGRIASAMASSACTGEDRARVEQLMSRSKARGLEGLAD